MKFNRRHYVEKALGDDPAKPELTRAWFDGGRLHACDGKVYVSLPATPNSGDAPGWVSEDDVKAARKAAGRGPLASTPVACDDTAPPPYDRIVPARDERHATIAIDPALLTRIAAAIDAKGVVTLTFPVPAGNRDNMTAPIVVRRREDVDAGDDVAFGVLAPAEVYKW